MTAPSKLKAWRESQGITQTAAASASGVSQATWSDWEAGKKIPRVQQAVMLATFTSGAVPVESWVTEGTAA